MAPDDVLVKSLVDQFDATDAGLPGAGLPWLAGLRRAGRDRFAALGLPTTRVEDWKYTSLRALKDIDFTPAWEAGPVAWDERIPSVMPDGGGPRLVFVDGRFDRRLSSANGLPPGVVVETLAEALARDPDALAPALKALGDGGGRSMLALNTAFMDEGVVVRLGAGIVVADAIRILHLGGVSHRPLAWFPRNVIALGAGSEATVVEEFFGMGATEYFADVATSIALGAGARLRHAKVQSEGLTAVHLATHEVRLDRDARYESFYLATGGRLSRNEVSVRLEGEGAEARLAGVYLTRGAQHCDNTTVIEHIAPNTRCREVFKGVLDDESRAVFQGRIVVHRGAQKADGHQLCKTLLLSDHAEINAKPELEIYADDVKCSHGAASGQIDHDALFYLRSRGVPEAQARNLLIQSFLAEALAEVDDATLREALTQRATDWLPAACFRLGEWRKE